MNMSFYINIMLSISLMEKVKKIENNISEIEKLINDLTPSTELDCNLTKCLEYLRELDFIISDSRNLISETVLRK